MPSSSHSRQNRKRKPDVETHKPPSHALALPLGELSATTECGGRLRGFTAVCFPQNVPIKGAHQNPLRHGLRRATSPKGRGKGMPYRKVVPSYMEFLTFSGASCGTGDPSPTIELLDFLVYLACISTKMFIRICRGGVAVKRDMVYTLCRHMVYTF